MGTYAITKSELLAATAGGLLAFISHDAVDRLGETSYGDFKSFLKMELTLLALFVFSAAISGFWHLFIIGWIGGNAMDLVDKKGGLSILNKKKYPFTKIFRCHRRQPNITFNQDATYTAGFISGIVIVLIGLISS
jgi:hypothetical protein